MPYDMQADYEWFTAHQQELSSQYPGKVIAIHDQQIEGIFENMETAYTAMVAKHELGSFSLQVAEPDPEDYLVQMPTPMFSLG